jgi:hypothetical protein
VSLYFGFSSMERSAHGPPCIGASVQFGPVRVSEFLRSRKAHGPSSVQQTLSVYQSIKAYLTDTQPCCPKCTLSVIINTCNLPYSALTSQGSAPAIITPNFASRSLISPNLFLLFLLFKYPRSRGTANRPISLLFLYQTNFSTFVPSSIALFSFLSAVRAAFVDVYSCPMAEGDSPDSKRVQWFSRIGSGRV